MYVGQTCVLRNFARITRTVVPKRAPLGKAMPNISKDKESEIFMGIGFSPEARYVREYIVISLFLLFVPL